MSQAAMEGKGRRRSPEPKTDWRELADAPYLQVHDELDILADEEDGLISLLCSDYRPAGAWDVDEWEGHTATIKAPADRAGWRIAYATARRLARAGFVMISGRNGDFMVRLGAGPMSIDIN